MYRLQWSWDLKMCPHFSGCYVQASMELALLERCPHFRGCYVQASMELGPEDETSKLKNCNLEREYRDCRRDKSQGIS